MTEHVYEISRSLGTIFYVGTLVRKMPTMPAECLVVKTPNGPNTAVLEANTMVVETDRPCEVLDRFNKVKAQHNPEINRRRQNAREATAKYDAARKAFEDAQNAMVDEAIEAAMS